MRWKTTEYAGWGRALRGAGQMARPERMSSLAALMADEPAPAIGNGRSYGDACLNDGGKVVSTVRLDRILSFDPETDIVEVEAGATIGDLAAIFGPKGWLPAVMPGTGFATVGGAIANDVHGKNHHGAGSFGQHVVAITLILPGGEVRRIDTDDPLFAATVGGLGQTGMIASAALRLVKCKGDVMIVTERRIAGWDEFLDRLDRSDATYCVGWIDATARGDTLGRGILEEGETGSGVITKRGKVRAVPFDAPGVALSPPVVKAFNAAYFRRVPKQGRTVIRPIADFFFPLDKIRDWNRLYGRAGFHQFQCVVPIANAPALRAMLERIAKSGLASPLAVLKRMGPGRAGMLSFPMEGYTLAVDFANRARATRLIGELEADTLAAKGRIYLAKDALSKGATIRAMYPEHGDWAGLVNAADPGHAMATDLIRRLDLRSV